MHNNINVNVSGPMQPTSTYKTVVLKGNHSFASQVTEPNTKYVIKYNFDLSNEEVIIPERCLIEFDGGSISNGTLVGQSTILIYNQPLNNILTATLDGTWTDYKVDVDKRIENLEEAIGEGGSVDDRIAVAKAEVIGNATPACNTLGEAEALISAEASARQSAISNVIGDAASDYNTLGKLEDKIKEEANARGEAVSAEAERAQAAEADRYTKSETYNKSELNNMITTPEIAYNDYDTYADMVAETVHPAGAIYRVANYDGTQAVTNKYAEYSWDGTQYKLMAVRDHGVDDEPTIGSDNLVKSDGAAKASYIIKDDIDFTIKSYGYKELNDEGKIIDYAYGGLRITKPIAVTKCQCTASRTAGKGCVYFYDADINLDTGAGFISCIKGPINNMYIIPPTNAVWIVLCYNYNESSHYDLHVFKEIVSTQEYIIEKSKFKTGEEDNNVAISTSGSDFVNPNAEGKKKLPSIGAIKEHEHEMLNQYFDQLDNINAIYGNAGISGLYIDTKNVPDFDSSKLVVNSFYTSGTAFIKYDGIVVLSAEGADKEAVKMKRQNGGLLDGYIKLDIAAIGRITSSAAITVNLSPNYKAYDASFFPASIEPKYNLNIIKPIVYPTASTQTLEPCSCLIDAYGDVLEKYDIIRIANLKKSANYKVYCTIKYGNNENYLNSISGMISNTDWNNGVRTITFYNFNLFIVVNDNIEHLTDTWQQVNGDLRVRYVKDNKTRSSVAPIIKFSDALEEQIKVCNVQSNLAPIPFDTFVVNPDNIYGVLSYFQKYENDDNTSWWYSNMYPCLNPSTYFGRCYRKTWYQYNENDIDDVLVECVEKHTRIGYIGFCMFSSKNQTEYTNNITKPNNWSEKQSVYENNLSDYSFSFDTSNNFLIDGKAVYTELPNDVIWEMIEEDTLPNFRLHTSNGYYIAYPNYNSESLYLWWKSFIETLGSYLNGTITYNGVTYTRKNLVECVRVMCIGIYGEGSCVNGGTNENPLCIFSDDDAILRDYFKLYKDNFTNRLLIPMASTYDYNVNLYSDTTWEYLWTLTNDAGLSGVFFDMFGLGNIATWMISGNKLSDNISRFDMRNRPFNGEFASSSMNEYGLYTLNYMFKYGAYGVSMNNINRLTPLGKEQITKCAITMGAKLFISQPELSDNTLSYRIQNIGISYIYSPYWKAKYVFRGEDNSLLSEVDANLSVQAISPNSIDYEEAGLIGNGTFITENITIPSGTKKILFKIADIYGVYENYYLHNYGRTEDGEYLLFVLNT